MRARMMLLMPVLLSACVHGQAVENETVPASTPLGRHVALRVSDAPGSWSSRVIAGELLYTEPRALVVLTDSTIVRVPLERLRHFLIYPVRPRAQPERDIPSSTAPFRYATRYPEPLSEDRLRELIETLGVEWIDLGAQAVDTGGTSSLGALPRHAAMQGAPGEELSAFLAEARSASARLASIEAAIAEGYRRLGPSFPGMGEHWIQPGRIVAGRVDAARPSVVSYVRLHGQPRLVSLAYTVPLAPDELPPAEPFGRAVWHDHVGSVDEESLLLIHPGSNHAGDGTRLAMVHVWVWPTNPAGVLAQNNWRLPFAVAGLPFAEIDPSVDAGRGLSLHTAGAGYYETLFVEAADPSGEELRALRDALAEHQELAAAWARQAGETGVIEADDLAAIAAVWSSLWDRIHSRVGPDTWNRLAPLR